MVKITGTSKCNPGTGEYSVNFQQYIQQCASSNDISRLNNIIDPADYIESIERLSALTDDLIISNEGIQTTYASAGMNAGGLDARIRGLETEIDTLQNTKKSIQSETEAADRTFLDTITNEQPSAEGFPTLQDISIGIFVFGWLILGLSLITVRTIGPSGSFKGGALVFILFLFVTALMYALLKIIA